MQRLQNRAARIVTGNYDYVTTRGTGLVRRLRWMCVTQRRDYVMSILMFKSIHGMAPAYLCNYAHLDSFKNSFTHRGPIVWNSLPDYIKTCRTFHSFKAKMKLFTMN